MLWNIQRVRSGLSTGKLLCNIPTLRTSNRRLISVSAISSAASSTTSPAIHRCPSLGLQFSRSGCHLNTPVWRGSISTFKQPRNFHTASVLLDEKFVDVMTPPFAESITQGEIRWEKAVNDTVETDEVLGEIETDKTAIPVSAPTTGVIVELYVEDGAVVDAGSKLCRLRHSDAPLKEQQASPSTSAEAPPPVEQVSFTAEQPPAPSTPTATPTVPIDTPIPSTVPPTPPLPGQPLAQMTPPPPPPPPPVASPASSKVLPTGSRTEKRVRLSLMRQRIGERLKEAQNVNAMLTTFNEVDMSNTIALRAKYKEEFLKKHGVKLGFMSAFVRASVHALQDQPVVNAVIEGKEIVYRDYIDISVAVATPKGLVVPVLRNVETMNFADIELAINELGLKARDGALAVEDMDGGTFTISNGGVFGSLYGTPIINPPQSAILGMHATKDRPVAINGKVEIRPMMYVALTYDHRLIDGREAVLFLKKIKSAVEDPQVVLLDI